MAYVEENFHPMFVWAVNQALAECGGATVGSGYRSVKQQAGLLGKRASGVSVADPGHSRHNGADNYEGIEGASGGAVDMEGDLKCFAKAGAKYGLSNTMVPDEDWHFQFTDEAWQAVLDGTYADMFGVEEEAQEENWGDAIRRTVFGGQQPDIPDIIAHSLKAKSKMKTKDGGGFTPEASAGFSSDGTALSATDVASYYAQAGFTGEALVNMVAISRGESGWNPGARGDTSLTDGTWGPSIGLSQIRSLNDQSGTGGWRDGTRLADPLFNARAAYAISNGGTNFGPWTVWNEGIYKQYLDEARAAVAALGTGAVAGTGPPVASVEPEDEMGIGELFNPTDTAGLSTEIADMILSQRSGDPLAKAGLKDKDEVEEPYVPW